MTPAKQIYLTGYTTNGKRRATAQEQQGFWTFHTFNDDGSPISVSRAVNLQEVVGRMKDLECTLFLGVPSSDAPKDFIEHFTACMCSQTTRSPIRKNKMPDDALLEARAEASVFRELLAAERRALPQDERARRKIASRRFLFSTIIGALRHKVSMTTALMKRPCTALVRPV